MVHLEEDLVENRVKVDPLTCVRTAVWGVLYADDAGIVSKSAEGLAKMMAVIVTVFEAAGLTVYEKKTKNNAAADTEPCTSDSTARHRSSGTEVKKDNAVLIPGRCCRRKS